MKTRNEAVEVKFTKKFFSEVLLTKASDLEYKICKYEDKETCIAMPVIMVKNISKWFFAIEYAFFVRIGKKHKILDAKVEKVNGKVRFISEDRICEELEMDSFYRRYNETIITSEMISNERCYRRFCDPAVHFRRGNIQESVRKHRYIKLEFSKNYFARILHVKPTDLRFVLFEIYVGYDGHDEPYIYRPAVAIKFLPGWYYFIGIRELHKIKELSEGIRIINVRFYQNKDCCFFKSVEEGFTFVEYKVDFYRREMTKIANTLIED